MRKFHLASVRSTTAAPINPNIVKSWMRSSALGAKRSARKRDKVDAECDTGYGEIWSD